MDATADDWESIAQVIPDVEASLGPQDPAEIKGIILRLFEDGMFEMMPLEGLTMGSLQTDFDRCWFSMTTEGRRLWDEDGIHYRTETAEPSHPANPRNAGG